MLRLVTLFALAALGCSSESEPRPAEAGGAPDADLPDVPLMLVAPAEPAPAAEGDAGARSSEPASLIGEHRERVGELAWSPDGDTIATCGLGEEQPRGGITLWDARSLRPLVHLFPIPDSAPYLGPFEWESCAIDWSPDGRWLAEARIGRNEVRIWDVIEQRLSRTLTVERVRSVTVSPDGRLLGATLIPRPPPGSRRPIHTIVLLDPTSGDERRRVTSARPITGISFDPEGRRIFASGRRPQVFDRRTGRRLGSRRGFRHPVHLRGRAFDARRLGPRREPRPRLTAQSPDGRWRATLAGGQLRLERADSEDDPRRLPLPEADWSLQVALAFDPTSSVLAVAASRAHERLQNELTSEVSLWNVATGEALDQDSQPTCRLGATPRYSEGGQPP